MKRDLSRELRYYLDNLWRWKCGIEPYRDVRLPDVDTLKRTEWSIDFSTTCKDICRRRYLPWSDRMEELRKNRMVMGAFRYERFDDKKKHFPYDMIAECRKRWILYKESGNQEHLVDIGNCLMIEFEVKRPDIEHVPGYPSIIGRWSCIEHYLLDYEKTHRGRYLVLCYLEVMHEFIQPIHRTPYFASVDDGTHVEKIR